MPTVALRVPRRDTQTVKTLGARWDPAEGHWYAPADRDQHVFAAWLPPRVPNDGALVPADIVLMPEVCYRCQQWTEPVVGLKLPRAALDDGAEYLMEETNGRLVPPLRRDERRRHRNRVSRRPVTSQRRRPAPVAHHRFAPEGYLANTCLHCGTVLGNFPLFEALTEYETEDGELNGLPQIDTTIPHSALDWLRPRTDLDFE
ncbi:MAG: DUF5710 domain-containing protein [Acidimicrobiia bacterium]